MTEGAYAYTCFGARAGPDVFLHKSAAAWTSGTCIRKCSHCVINRFSAQDKLNRKYELIYRVSKVTACLRRDYSDQTRILTSVTHIVPDTYNFGGAKSVTWVTTILTLAYLVLYTLVKRPDHIYLDSFEVTVANAWNTAGFNIYLLLRRAPRVCTLPELSLYEWSLCGVAPDNDNDNDVFTV